MMMKKSRSTSMVPITMRRGEGSKGVRRTTHDLEQHIIDVKLEQQNTDITLQQQTRIREENIAITLS